MPSEKVTRILQSKTDLSAEQIAALSDNEAWQIVYSFRSDKAREDANRLQICFTGFGTSKKNELASVAEGHDMRVVTTVTKHLDYLCAGENAGPKKLEKAANQGVQLLTESEFLTMLETGEIPKP